jgi:hypothetical protein
MVPVAGSQFDNRSVIIEPSSLSSIMSAKKDQVVAFVGLGNMVIHTRFSNKTVVGVVGLV